MLKNDPPPRLQLDEPSVTKAKSARSRPSFTYRTEDTDSRLTDKVQSAGMIVSENDPPFLLLDEAAIAASELRRDPYDFTYVARAIDPRFKDEVLADAPAIPDRGSYGLPSLRYGPRFDTVINDLLNPRFRHLVEKKFNMDLSPYVPCIVMMGNTTGHYNEGHAHPDSRHKIVTVLLGFSPEWPYERGRLRIMRSKNLDDYAFRICAGIRPHVDVPRLRSFLARFSAAEGHAHELAVLLG